MKYIAWSQLLASRFTWNISVEHVSQTLVQRVSNYITGIEKKSPGCNIENHFLKADYSIADFSVLGIVKLENPPPDPIDRLREFEGYWMIKLNTLEPYGLNGINEYERIVKKSGLRNMFDRDVPGESRC